MPAPDSSAFIIEDIMNAVAARELEYLGVGGLTDMGVTHTFPGMPTTDEIAELTATPDAGYTFIWGIVRTADMPYGANEPVSSSGDVRMYHLTRWVSLAEVDEEGNDQADMERAARRWFDVYRNAFMIGGVSLGGKCSSCVPVFAAYGEAELGNVNHFAVQFDLQITVRVNMVINS